jgi:hypothetical protein
LYLFYFYTIKSIWCFFLFNSLHWFLLQNLFLIQGINTYSFAHYFLFLKLCITYK